MVTQLHKVHRFPGVSGFYLVILRGAASIPKVTLWSRMAVLAPSSHPHSSHQEGGKPEVNEEDKGHTLAAL